ncbi:MAG TPA: hypothetical protein VJ373_01535 [Desulfatiglandales bacterium]|nr:hypothetical protein [Desulfatiglandales bacterium]
MIVISGWSLSRTRCMAGMTRLPVLCSFAKVSIIELLSGHAVA